MKYFPNHLAIDKDVKMNQKRYFVEKDALKLLGDHCFLEKTHTRIPKLLYFDDNNFIIVMQDAGKQCKTLLKFLLNQTPHTAHSQKIIDILAKEIYNFSIFLSNSGINPQTHSVPFKNESAWSIFKEHLIPLYRAEAKRFNLESDLEVVLNELTQPPKEHSGFFVFGDLWPSRIMINLILIPIILFFEIIFLFKIQF